jgi:hypothetical protein
MHLRHPSEGSIKVVGKALEFVWGLGKPEIEMKGHRIRRVLLLLLLLDERFQRTSIQRWEWLTPWRTHQLKPWK